MYSNQHHTQASICCYHCGEECRNETIAIEDKKFCCSGCKMVYEILNENELCTYYSLNNNPGSSQKINVRDDKFEFLDVPEIASKIISFTDGKQTQVTFYLPQIHCSSCLWLLENCNRINKGITSCRINFTKKEAFVIFSNEETTLRSVVETLTQIGYEPHLSLQDISTGRAKKIAPKKLFKLGIAGFCFTNIMMMSFPEYFSINGMLEKEIGAAFHFFIIALSLPVIFYCASEFYTSAWAGLKNKFLNIDLPIALALSITFVRSLYELFTHTGQGYLDSMSGIVFFMLLGRLVQERTYRAISFDRDFKSFFPVSVHVKKGQAFKPVMASALKQDDIILIRSNEIIPADAILSKGFAKIDYSFVSGESIPVEVAIGEIIYAGGKQMAGNLELIVVKEVSQSYLTNLWNKDVFSEEKMPVSLLHGLSKYFTFIVLAIGSIAAVYWLSRGETLLMMNALTTILIVACPCALLLSSTFTNGNILRILSKHQFYLRHPDVIEDLANINHIVVDKTGTITERKNVETEYEGYTLSQTEEYMVGALLAQSSHPLCKIIYEQLGAFRHEEILSFKEIPGKGIEGWINEKHLKIGSADFVQKKSSEEKVKKIGSTVFIKIDDQVLGFFRVGNIYRKGFEDVLRQLKKRCKVSLLSGDNNNEEEYLATVFGKNAELLFNQLPEEKHAYIKKLQSNKKAKVLMLGDGLNDAVALRQSNVGIAISDDTNNFTPASDGILNASMFTLLPQFIAFATSSQKIIYTSFALSILYNVIGLWFAVQGILSPLIAAILMPASSLSIILITYGMSEWAAKKNGL